MNTTKRIELFIRAIEVMKAYLNGTKIEYRMNYSKVWIETDDPQWNWDGCEYRVKQHTSRTTP
jgi:alkanesulfonate monooxygenase SsuD/methylene tetrahydromethanopterin reductase-like flavin-dependent oxidoreductase (luciferase family)